LLEDLGALLKDTSTTTVFVTHDLPEAAQLASRMAVIVGNRLRQAGNPELVFTSPADEEVASFVNHRVRKVLNFDLQSKMYKNR
jgi:ABC-type proline/glycine betaine transport system ATPase subunit